MELRLPIEIVQKIFSHTGQIDSWFKFNAELPIHMQSKMPKYLLKEFELKRLINVIYRNESLKVCDFFTNAKFNWTFAKKLFNLSYTTNQFRKCLNILTIIINNPKHEKYEFAKSVTFYEELRIYVFDEMEMHIIYEPHCKPYLYLPNDNDFEKFSIYLELFVMTRNEGYSLYTFLIESMCKKVTIIRGSYSEVTLPGKAFYDVTLPKINGSSDIESEQQVRARENFEKDVKIGSCDLCYNIFPYTVFSRWFLH